MWTMQVLCPWDRKKSTGVLETAFLKNLKELHVSPFVLGFKNIPSQRFKNIPELPLPSLSHLLLSLLSFLNRVACMGGWNPHWMSRVFLLQLF